MNLATVFLSSAITRFNEEKRLGDKSIAQLSEKDMHWQANKASNSIAVIIQHMHGNMLSRWTNFLFEDGEKDWRMRDEEFEPSSLTKEELIAKWNEGWKTLFDTLESLWEDDLLRTIYIRNQPLKVVDAINRQLAHYSYHVGQIVFISKLLKNEEWKTLSIPRGESLAYTVSMNK